MDNCEWLKVSKHTTYAAVVKRHNNSINYMPIIDIMALII